MIYTKLNVFIEKMIEMPLKFDRPGKTCVS